jgi:gamma-aminobutyric acid receptor subunit beta
MAKRIQMRKQRFMAIQKIAEQKKIQVDNAQQNNPPSSGVGSVVGPPSEHSHSHGHSHSHHPHVPKQPMGTMGNRGPPGMSLQGNVVGSRGCSIVGPLFQEVRFKVHDPKAHSKGGTLENTINGGRGGQQQQQQPAPPPSGGNDEESAGGGGGAPQHLIHPGKVSELSIIIITIFFCLNIKWCTNNEHLFYFFNLI